MEGAHQSLLTLMKTFACQYREGVGLVTDCGMSICYCMGMDFVVGMRKDWGGMGECYNFEENGGLGL